MKQPFPYLLLPVVWSVRNRARRRERGDTARASVFGGIGLLVAVAIFAVVFWLSWQLLGYEELGDYLLLMATLELQARKETQSYFLPLDVSWDDAAGTPNWPLTPFTLAKARRGSKVGAIYDAFTSDQFVLALVDAMRKGADLTGADGTTDFASTEALAAVDFGNAPEIRRIGVEQPIVEVFSNDKRLADLAAWDPAADASA